jgi:hypothetical protein
VAVAVSHLTKLAQQELQRKVLAVVLESTGQPQVAVVLVQ